MTKGWGFSHGIKKRLKEQCHETEIEMTEW
jgi:hypothetical protein